MTHTSHPARNRYRRLGPERAVFTSLLLLALAPLAAGAQQNLDLPAVSGQAGNGDSELVDRVVAVVGDSAVFYSEIQQRLLQLEASGAQIPQDSATLAQFERDILESLVDQAVVLRAARGDSLAAVTDAELDQRFQQAWQEEVRRFGSEEELADAVRSEFDIPLSEYRAEQRENLRQQMLLSRYIELQRDEARLRPVDEAEVRAYFESEQARFGQRPATISFEQVSVAPQPSDSVRSAAREDALEILEMLREGEEFSDLARRFSDDPGSNQRGGELGWVRQGTMVEAFEDAAFRLRRGETSGVVETQFGSHIIRVERISGPERLLHHILVAVEPTAEDITAARERAQAIRDSVAAGAPIEQFRTETDLTPLPDSATLARDQVDQFPESLANALRVAQEGDVLGPVEIPTPQGAPGFMVLHVREVREAGEFPYEEVQDQIREQLQRQQFERRLVERLRSRTYVDIRW